MQKTTNYQLPKWEKTDRILMDDFNGMTGALDTALHGVAVSAEAAQAAVDSEAANRQAADAAEATARENAVTAEATARADAVTAERASCSAALSAETTARINADAAEAAERANADAALQSAINGKAASSHTHAQSDITGLTAALGTIAETTTYIGNGGMGEANAVALTFSRPPKAAFLWGVSANEGIIYYAFLVRGSSHALVMQYAKSSTAYQTYAYLANVIWTENGFRLYSTQTSGSGSLQMNYNNQSYVALALT